MSDRVKKLETLLLEIRAVLAVQNALVPSETDRLLIDKINEALNQPKSQEAA